MCDADEKGGWGGGRNKEGNTESFTFKYVTFKCTLRGSVPMSSVPPKSMRAFAWNLHCLCLS